MFLLAPSAPEAVRLADPPRSVPGAVLESPGVRALSAPPCPAARDLLVRCPVLAAHGLVHGVPTDDLGLEELWGRLRGVAGGASGLGEVVGGPWREHPALPGEAPGGAGRRHARLEVGA